MTFCIHRGCAVWLFLFLLKWGLLVSVEPVKTVHVEVDLCYGMVCSQLVDGGDSLHTWSLAGPCYFIAHPACGLGEVLTALHCKNHFEMLLSDLY